MLSDEAIFTYKVDNVYEPNSEASIRYDDPELGIEWPISAKEILLSPKDEAGRNFSDAELFD